MSVMYLLLNVTALSVLRQLHVGHILVGSAGSDSTKISALLMLLLLS